MGWSLYINFCDFPLLSTGVPGRNYQTLATDATFHKVVGNTLLYSLLSVPLGALLAVLLALLLNRKVRGQAFFRACIFLPTVVPLTAAAVVWMWMLNSRAGIINAPWKLAEIAPPNWFNEAGPAMAALVIISLWFVAANDDLWPVFRTFGSSTRRPDGGSPPDVSGISPGLSRSCCSASSSRS